MPDEKSTARESDDLETAERKSKTIDERVPARDAIDAPEILLPGAVAANLPQGGIGREGPYGTDAPGPGEVVLEQESKAQRTPTARG